MFYDINQSVSMYIGSIGCGKTYTIAYLVNKYSQKGYTCFHNVDTLKVGIYLPVEHLIKYKLPRGSLYFLDESGAELNNRLWKSIDVMYTKVVKYTRHDGVSLHVFSQSPLDTLIDIRRLCVYNYFLNRVLWFTFASKWKKSLVPPTKENKNTDFVELYKRINFFPHIQLRRKEIFALYDSFSPIPNDTRVPYVAPTRTAEEQKIIETTKL